MSCATAAIFLILRAEESICVDGAQINQNQNKHQTISSHVALINLRHTVMMRQSG